MAIKEKPAQWRVCIGAERGNREEGYCWLCWVFAGILTDCAMCATPIMLIFHNLISIGMRTYLSRHPPYLMAKWRLNCISDRFDRHWWLVCRRLRRLALSRSGLTIMLFPSSAAPPYPARPPCDSSPTCAPRPEEISDDLFHSHLPAVGSASGNPAA